EHFEPKLPENYRDAQYVFLANINPELQLSTLEQVKQPKLVLCDTMNLWINIAREHVLEVFRRVDIAVLNDGEARLLTDQGNIIAAGRQLLDLGPRAIIIKKGEHGALMFSKGEHPASLSEGIDIFSAPSYPLEQVVDPTGAGDSFAGAFIGYLAKTDDLSMQNLRRAVVYGSVVASTTVQDFSTASLAALTPDSIAYRYGYVREMSKF
ncbi:MAG: hypothetical protein JOZ57_02200, partial [Abitibacteriaceae bacterium]|nr:hypothetical protein [Abditibacteriaceae bacterium]